MQEVRIITWCDYPGCAEAHKEDGAVDGQDTHTVEYWVYSSGKGRKTNPIKVELCDLHREYLKTIFTEMQKHDQNKEK